MVGRRLPVDWRLVIVDHGPDGLLVEVRENGALRHREWLSIDDVLSDPDRMQWLFLDHHPDGRRRLGRPA